MAITIEREIDILKCRTFGHAWDDISGLPEAEHTSALALTGERFMLRCLRCETKREDIVSRSHGGLITRAYYYADDYKLVTADSRPDFRLQYLDRRDKLAATKKRTSGSR